jgi:putative membrane protein
VSGFPGEDGKAALAAAAREVEAASDAEVVIAVRPQSGPYRDADLLAGIAAALATLAFQLFSPWEFELAWIFVETILVGMAGAVLASRMPPLRRLLTSVRRRREAVHAAACAAFHDKGIGGTARSTGILIYVSLLERTAEVLPDRGVAGRVEGAVWSERVAAIQDAVQRRAPATELAARIAALKPLLAARLPRTAGDVDELQDEMVS